VTTLLKTILARTDSCGSLNGISRLITVLLPLLTRM